MFSEDSVHGHLVFALTEHHDSWHCSGRGFHFMVGGKQSVETSRPSSQYVPSDLFLPPRSHLLNLSPHPKLASIFRNQAWVCVSGTFYIQTITGYHLLLFTMDILVVCLCRMYECVGLYFIIQFFTHSTNAFSAYSIRGNIQVIHEQQ
jgi:hypothetical protein